MYIAAGTGFAGTLSAAPAGAHGGGPLLLTLPDRIPAAVSDEITRLAPESIVVGGGVSSIKPTVFSALEDLAPTIHRIDDANRFVVSRSIAEYAFGDDGSEIAFFANSAAFAHELSASATASAIGARWSSSAVRLRRSISGQRTRGPCSA